MNGLRLRESGEYDLEGLFVRLGYAVDSVGAKRVVLDTIETLFSGFTDPALLRAELRRLFGWIKERGLTAIITGERGEGQLTRQGLEVVRVRLRRPPRQPGGGPDHHPAACGWSSIAAQPTAPTSTPSSSTVPRHQRAARHRIGSRAAPHPARAVSTGVPGLDAMLRNGGFYRGSTILFSGVAGTGKTTFASHFADAACTPRRALSCPSSSRRSAQEICRNAAVRWARPDHSGWTVGLAALRGGPPQSLYGLEMHLARMHRDLDRFRPNVVVVDPISAFRGPTTEVHATLLRMMDLLKSRGITALFSSLRNDGALMESADLGLSSLMDAWIRLEDVEANGERNRALYLIKARGMSHSNQVRSTRSLTAEWS